MDSQFCRPVTALLLLVSLMSPVHSFMDATTTADTFGPDIVETVIDRILYTCIFPDDKDFLRHLAYVETADGTHPFTYTACYHGGIWKMDEDMFDLTIASTAPYIALVNAAFGINWASMSWIDMRKPLYCGLAARIYIEETRTTNLIPRPIADQGLFYVDYYKQNRNPAVFETLADRLVKGCKRANADVVFVLDASGSVGAGNFQQMLLFVNQVISGFTIGADDTRIGLIRFATSPSLLIDLDTSFDQSTIMGLVSGTGYTAGGTNTADALAMLTDIAFGSAKGARSLSEGVPRVGIVITDGESNNLGSTLAAAQRAHDQDITMFAIGVGNPLMTELQAIATDPDCLHLFMLTGFAEFVVLGSIIERRTCDAPIIFQLIDYSLFDQLAPGQSQNCKIEVPAQGATIQIITTVGKLAFYIAHDTFPSSVYYQDMVYAKPDQPGLIFVDYGQDGVVFCNYQAMNVTIDNSNVTIETEQGEINNCNKANKKKCGDHGTCSSTLFDFYCVCKDGWSGKKCDVEEKKCDKAFELYYKKGDMCYHVSDKEASYKDAKKKCENKGGSLTSVLDKKENEFLAQHKDPKEFYWIGLSRGENAANEGRNKGWAWHDGSPFSYTNWIKRHPMIGHQCAGMKKPEGSWASVDCETRAFRYICKEVPPVVVATTTAPPCNCDLGWLKHKQSCYHFSATNEKLSTRDSRSACIAMDGTADLVSITSAAEKNFIRDNKASSADHWIGYAYDDGEAAWVWTNGDPVDYTNWKEGHPESLSHKCSKMFSTNGKWKSDMCDGVFCQYICEMPCF